MLANPAVVPETAQFASLELRILATTVQGQRLAAESESIGRRRDGLEYHNFYHQVWRFNDAGLVVEYRIYDDSEHVAATNMAGNLLVVRRFLGALAAGDADTLATLVTDGFRLVVPAAAGTTRTLDRAAVCAALAGRSASNRACRLDILPGGITASGDRLAIEARSADPGGSLHHLLFQLERYRIAELRDYSPGPALLTATD